MDFQRVKGLGTGCEYLSKIVGLGDVVEDKGVMVMVDLAVSSHGGGVWVVLFYPGNLSGRDGGGDGIREF